MKNPESRSRLVDFVSDRRGAVFPFVALMIIPILGAVGLAVDAARAYLVKEKLSFALDAAALAAARSVGTDYMEEDMEKYFNVNFPPGFMDVEVSGPNLVMSANSEIISVDASVSLETTFMKLAGFTHLDVGGSAEVTRELSDIDIVLAIDMSGSMSWSSGSGGSRISAAREAALDLTENLYSLSTVENLNIGLVPWSHIVNVTENGTTFSSSSSSSVPTFTHPLTDDDQNELYYADNSPVPLMTEPVADWAGCVYARFEDDGASTNDADTEFGPGTYGDNDWEGWEPTVDDQNDDCPSFGITPLQDSQSTIEDAIDELTDPEGATNIAQGLLWAWRVMMPDEPFTEADPNPDPVPYRTIILLTDGEHCGWTSDAYSGALGGCSSAQDDLDDRLRTIAGNVKSQGIEIITIQFANGGTDLEELMQDVATGPSAPYYYYAPDGETLQTVFAAIASHLAKLHLSK